MKSNKSNKSNKKSIKFSNKKPLSLRLNLNNSDAITTNENESNIQSFNSNNSKPFKIPKTLNEMYDEIYTTSQNRNSSIETNHFLRYFNLVRENFEIPISDNKIKQLEQLMKTKNSILHPKGSFPYNPNGKPHRVYSNFFLKTKGNVTTGIKIYECEDNDVSFFNIILEVFLQQYSQKILNKIDSIKVPSIYEYGRFKSSNIAEDRIFYYIEMEYIPYDNISVYLKKQGLNTIQLIDNKNCILCDKITKGINLLFKYGIYHNDLNGENLLVDGNINNPDVYLIDFGNATPYKIYPLESNTYKVDIPNLKFWFNMKPRTGGKSKKKYNNSKKSKILVRS